MRTPAAGPVVGLVRTRPGYGDATAPFGPGPAGRPELPGALASGDEGSAAIHAAVRAALFAAGLDAGRFGREDWNPLGDLVRPGGHVVLKPNFIRHFHPDPDGGLECVVTHGALLRAVADYAWRAVGRGGRVTVAEAPQQDCDFDRIRAWAGLDAMRDFYAESLGADLGIVDLRREAVVFRGGVIVARRSLPGDPAGYREVDLGRRSFFEGSGLEPRRFRGADYDPGATVHNHAGGRHAYLLSETVLSADLVVNLPKMKTHKKTGVTLALKNLVGLNGDKNWLPHHTVGSPAEGGDEHPDAGRLDRWRSRAAERARPWLARGRALPFFRAARRVERTLRGDDFVRSGNWWGNRTAWRMCCDINRALYYSDRKGLHLEAEAPVRPVLTVLDGVVAGEGRGPLAPHAVPLGLVLAGTDPVALDVAAVRLMGFDERRIPKIAGALDEPGPRFTAVRDPEEVRVRESDPEGRILRELQPAGLRADPPFEPHPGWKGHIEQEGRA